MYFEDLKLLLLENVRRRVHNGELSERGLAKLIGISQPHMHNILKGTRMFSSEVADRILYHLRISLLDICDPKEFERYVKTEGWKPARYSHVPVLRGRIGPDDTWPTAVEKTERFSIPERVVADMWRPVVCRLGKDDSMHPLYSRDDFALLDQSLAARTQLEEGRLYLVKYGGVGLIRHARQIGTAMYTYTARQQDQPVRWDNLPARDLSLSHFVRARVTLVSAESQWDSPA